VAQANNRQVYSVFGLAGSGKNLWTRRHLDGKTRVVIVDGGFTDEEDFDGIRVETFAEFHAYMKAHVDGLFRVRFCPLSITEFDFVCRWVREAGDLILVVDEADRFLAQAKIPESFQHLVARGRHWGVDMVLIASNPMQIHIDVRRQSTSMIIFNTTEPADLDWLRKIVGDEWGDKVPQLQPLHGIEWVKGAGCSEFVLDVPTGAA